MYRYEVVSDIEYRGYRVGYLEIEGGQVRLGLPKGLEGEELEGGYLYADSMWVDAGLEVVGMGDGVKVDGRDIRSVYSGYGGKVIVKGLGVIGVGLLRGYGGMGMRVGFETPAKIIDEVEYYLGGYYKGGLVTGVVGGVSDVKYYCVKGYWRVADGLHNRLLISRGVDEIESYVEKVNKLLSRQERLVIV